MNSDILVKYNEKNNYKMCGQRHFSKKNILKIFSATFKYIRYFDYIQNRKFTKFDNLV